MLSRIRHLSALLAIALLPLCLFGQHTHGRKCAAHDILLQQEERFPSLHQHTDEMERELRRWMQENPHTNHRANYIIPIVFHVLYQTPDQNLSDERVLAQLAQLNQDFSASNEDNSQVPAEFPVGNPKIQFCLADTDPQGNPTTGIVRQATNTLSFSSDLDDVKSSSLGGMDAWDTNSYMNIWICNLADDVLGYAQFPQMFQMSPETDGVVLSYTTVGSMDMPNPLGGVYGYGRTASHEMGHSLGLLHIWGDDGGACSGSDQVSDTPNQAAATIGCATYPQYSCGSNDMTMNYMDYSNDLCLQAFTPGQASRMNAIINAYLYWQSRTNATNVMCTNITEPGCNERDNLNGGTLGLIPNTAISNPGGYVSGHNGFEDIAKAEFFSNLPANLSLDGVAYDFGQAEGSGNVEFVIWENNGGTPGNELYTQEIPISILASNVANGERTQVDFGGEIPIPSSFFVGFKLDVSNGSQIAVHTNGDGDTYPATAWEQWSDGVWHSFGGDLSWGLDISLAIYPNICNNNTVSTEGIVPEPLGLNLYPNPVRELLYLYSAKDLSGSQVELFDLTGRLLLSTQVEKPEIDLRGWPAGTYLIRLTQGGQSHTKRFVKW